MGYIDHRFTCSHEREHFVQTERSLFIATGSLLSHVSLYADSYLLCRQDVLQIPFEKMMWSAHETWVENNINIIRDEEKYKKKKLF